MVAAASKLQSSHAFGGNLIMPSPSLPNLLLMSNKGATIGGDIGTNDDATPVDAVSADFGSQQSLAASETSAAANMLMQMQVQLASYLSMPSLLRGGPFTTLSMFRMFHIHNKYVVIL
jgi:hypothetical protein